MQDFLNMGLCDIVLSIRHYEKMNEEVNKQSKANQPNKQNSVSHSQSFSYGKVD
ncbi:hypothetical protein GMC59_12115 [Turicibacter sanguinis]|nr:hypothetical protein [Turicibacter sanguinis]MTP64978.1 hypothetical protein [Turicibacter sanguinis]